MSARLSIDEGFIAQVAGEFGLVYQASEMMTSGWSNQSYRLESDAGVRLLRFFRSQSFEHAQSELKLMANLRRSGVSCPEVFPSVRGDWALSSQYGPVALMEFIEGEHPKASEDGARLAGEAIAHLHQVELDPALRPPVQDHLSFCQTLAIGLEQSGRRGDHESLFTECLRRVEAPLSESAGTPALVHGDLFPDNAMVRDGRLVLFDFEDACWEPRERDLAFTAAGFCYEEGQLRRDWLEAMLEGYESVKPLEGHVRRILDPLILFGSVYMMSMYLRLPEGSLSERQQARLDYHARVIRGLLT